MLMVIRMERSRFELYQEIYPKTLRLAMQEVDAVYTPIEPHVLVRLAGCPRQAWHRDMIDVNSFVVMFERCSATF